MVRWFTGDKRRTLPRRRPAFFKPIIEILEDRRLLSSTGFLQGTVINDSTGAVQDGATVALVQSTTTLQTQTTGTNGTYLFTGLTPGAYQLVETPPAGFVNDDTLIVDSPVESASKVNASTIQVTIPSSIQLTVAGSQFKLSGTQNDNPGAGSGIAPTEILSYKLGSTTFSNIFVGQIIASGDGGTTTFDSFCVDQAPGHQLDGGSTNNVYTVQENPDLTGEGPPNLTTTNPNAPAAIAYLYNTVTNYGADTLTSVNAAALQVAIWTIEFNSTPTTLATDFTTVGDNFQLLSPNNSYITTANYNSVVSQAGTYLTDAVNAVAAGPLGQNGQAIFLAPTGTPTSGGEQGLIAPGSLNFSNIPLATPTITTSQQPASAVVGSSIADKATITGLVNANSSDTVTFNLYNNANGTGTALFTSQVGVTLGAGGTATATSAGFTTAATGTDYWVASFSGDSNNSPVTSGTALEPVTITPTSPAITTSQQPATAVVGGSIADQATITGLVNANSSDTVTFNLYNNANGTGTALFTSQVGVTLGAGGTATATSAGFTTAATGTDYWVASFSGDSNNSSVTSGTALEPVSITPTSPAITTSQQPASAVVGSSIADQATITGLVNANSSDTVTFNLYNNANGTGTALFTSQVGVTLGAGGTATATSAGFAPAATGTDYWVATFSGDSNNNSVSSGTALEPVTITPTTPGITTSQQPATAVVGSSIADQATITGLVNASSSDTVTFNLYDNPNGTGTALFTSQVGVTLGAGGMATATSAGFATAATGTDYWVATFSGDSNNSSVTSGTALEPVTITSVKPALSTTPGGTVSLGMTISGTKFNDLTGNGFSSDDTPQSGVTINLFQESNSTTGLQTGNGGDTLVASTTTASDGTYSFTVLNTGTYYVQEAVPSGYIQTGGGPNGTAGNTYYTVNVASGKDYSGFNFDDFQVPTCTETCISYKVTTPNGCSQTFSSLAGNTQAGDTVTVTFTVPAGQSDTMTLVSYEAPTPSWSDSNAYQQTIYQQATGTFGPGTHSLTVKIPNTYYQIDFVCGSAINELEPNQNNDAYGPDAANILYHAEDRFIDSDSGGTKAPSLPPASPPPIVTPMVTTAATLNDSATLSGGMNPGGQITFYLFGPGMTPTSNYSNAIYSDTVTVNGNGTYKTSMGNNPGGYLPTQAGTYQWVVVYGGDTNNSDITSGLGSEPEVVSMVTPSLSTTPGGTVVVDGNIALTDSATLSGGYNPGGTLTFYLFAPGVTPLADYSNNVYSDTVTVNGNGTYTTSAGNNPGGFIPSVAGTFEWLAVYNGDSNNNKVSDTFGDEGEVVTSAGPVSCGDFATIGFWHNCNGQAVIKSFNGGSSATQLGSWLASNFPDLFGTSNKYISGALTQFKATSLAGLTNAQVATVYEDLWTPSGVTKNTYVQAFAVALGMYADSASLGYDSTAASFGFHSVSGGGGSLTFNVGSNGAALGVANNTSLSVFNILQIADANFDSALGTFFNGASNQQSLTSALNNVLNGINSKGDI